MFNRQTHVAMKTVSLTPNESVPIRDLAKALATKALEFITSQRLSIVLGVVALVAILDFQLTGKHPVLMAFLTLVWATQLAAMLTLDIAKGGADL